MGFEHVFILNGILSIGWPPYHYPLRRKDNGLIEDFDYNGDAWCENGAVNILRYGSHGPVSEYIIDRVPTAASLDFKAGYEYADQQTKKHAPSASKSAAFQEGWSVRWSERRPFQYPDEIRAARNLARRKKRSGNDDVGAFVDPGASLSPEEDEAIYDGMQLLPPKQRVLFGIKCALRVLPIYEAEWPNQGLGFLLEEARANLLPLEKIPIGAILDQDPQIAYLAQQAYDRAADDDRDGRWAMASRSAYQAAMSALSAVRGKGASAAKYARAALSEEESSGWRRDILNDYLRVAFDEAMQESSDLPTLEGNDADITQAIIIRAQAAAKLREIFALGTSNKGLRRKAQWVSGQFEEQTSATEWVDALGGCSPQSSNKSPLVLLISHRFDYHPQEILNLWNDRTVKVPKGIVGGFLDECVTSVGAEEETPADRSARIRSSIVSLANEAHQRVTRAIEEENLVALLEAQPLSIEMAVLFVPGGFGLAKKPMRNPGQLRELAERLQEFANELKIDPDALDWADFGAESGLDGRDELTEIFSEASVYFYPNGGVYLPGLVRDHLMGVEWIVGILVKLNPRNNYLRALKKEIVKSATSLRRFDDTYQTLYRDDEIGAKATVGISKDDADAVLQEVVTRAEQEQRVEDSIVALLKEASGRAQQAIDQQSLAALIEAMIVSVEACYLFGQHHLTADYVTKFFKNPGQLRDLQQRLQELAAELKQDPSALTWAQADKENSFEDGCSEIADPISIRAGYGHEFDVRLWLFHQFSGSGWVLMALYAVKPKSSYLRILLKETKKAEKALDRFVRSYLKEYGHPYD